MKKEKKSSTKHNTAVRTAKMKGGIWAHPLTVDTMLGIFSSPLPPEMPEDCMPRPVKAALWNTPSLFRPSYSQCIFPPYGTLPNGVSFEYINGKIYEPKLNAVQVAPSGIGKNSISEINNHILVDVCRESEENLDKMVEHNEQNICLPDNSQKKRRPKDLPQRIVFADTTFPALCTQMKEAQGKFCFLEAKEIEDLYNLQSGRGGKSPLVILREADDPDGRIRQRRVGEKSVTVDVPLRLNYVISTTPASAQDFYKKDTIKGGLSRAEMTTIVKPEIGYEEPVFGRYDEKYDIRLRPFIDNLTNAHGLIVCKRAQQLARQLKKECQEFLSVTSDPVWDDLTHRALTHAFLKACIIYVANGCKWDPNTEPFIRWSFFYCMWVKCHYFMDAIRDAESKVAITTRGTTNKLTLIPYNIFSFEDVQKMRKEEGLDDSKEPTANQINVWVNRKYIVRLSDGRFEKLKFKS